MKTIFYLFLFTVGIGVAQAQDVPCATGQPADCQPAAVIPVAVPTVVYQAPVVYLAPVVYQGPVVYYAPVYYAPQVACAPRPACDDLASRSTVTYIGGGHVRFQVAGRNCGSTVTYIGGNSRR
jgi:hypothetical protein